MTAKSPKPPWYRRLGTYVVVGVGLLGLGLILTWASKSRQSEGSGPQESSHPSDGPTRSDVFWAEPSDLLFWVAMAVIAAVVIARIWRLVRRIRR